MLAVLILTVTYNYTNKANTTIDVGIMSLLHERHWTRFAVSAIRNLPDIRSPGSQRHSQITRSQIRRLPEVKSTRLHLSSSY